ncbi:MAG: CHAD domain-containing protein [Pseudomonadales bacterium]|nr:CHAD domain-containing protein [Pseudomonadales bacterium]
MKNKTQRQPCQERQALCLDDLLNEPGSAIDPSPRVRARVKAVIATLEQEQRCLALLPVPEPPQGLPGTAPDTIHRFRVAGKKLRAWLRLIRPAIGRDRWRLLDHALRDDARTLAGRRDREVMLKTLKRLQADSKKAEQREACARLGACLQVEEVTGTAAGDRAGKQTSPAGADTLIQLKRLSRMAHRPDIIARGLRKTWQRGRRWQKKAAAEDASFSDLHRFRKWVKYLDYQLHFSGLDASGKGHVLHRQLDQLASRLGWIHDLVVLRKALKQKSRHLPPEDPCRGDTHLVRQVIAAELRSLSQQYAKDGKKRHLLGQAGYFTDKRSAQP